MSVRGVYRYFGNRAVLEDISFELSGGEGICIVGPNAAGKSTLVRLIGGLLRPSRGVVKIGACEAGVDESARAMMGVVLHESVSYGQLTVEENLGFFARLYGVRRLGKRVREVIEEVGLGAYRYDYVDVLSAGMRQRLAVARALIHRPRILLADEPFSNLDTVGCKKMADILWGFRREGGVLILTTHHAGAGLRCCSRAAVLDRRRIVFSSPASELDKDRFLQDYLSYARERS